jgi:uncharacterized protein
MNLNKTNHARAILLMAFLSMAPTISTKGQLSYETRTERWRQEHEASLKAEDGWLSVAGLFWLKEGVNTFGTDANLDCVLPKNSAYGKVGSLELRSGIVTLNVADGATVNVNEKPVREMVLRTDADGTPDYIWVGSLKLNMIKRGARFGLRVRDRNSPARLGFTGLRWFPVNKSYRVIATFTPFDRPKEITILNVLGDVLRMKSPGLLSFRFKGRSFQLQPVVEDDKKLFVIFRDLTTKKTTYPAGRYLYADLPKDGRVVLDFNRAENPPCAFTSFATCPLPPKQNSLPIAIEAGELSYHLKSGG